MIPLSIHLPVCPFIQNEHAFKLELWYIIQSTGYVIKWLTTYSNDFFCIMMKFSFSRVLTWMYFYRYLTDAIFLKSSDVTGYFYDLVTAASFVLSYRGDMGTLHFCLLRCHWETLPFGWRFHWLHSGMKTWVLLANNDYIYKYI